MSNTHHGYDKEFMKKRIEEAKRLNKHDTYLQNMAIIAPKKFKHVMEVGIEGWASQQKELKERLSRVYYVLLDNRHLAKAYMVCGMVEFNSSESFTNQFKALNLGDSRRDMNFESYLKWSRMIDCLEKFIDDKKLKLKEF